MAREPKLTTGEKAKVAWYVARMAKRGLADDRLTGGRVHQRDLERKVERVIEQARAREERDAKKNGRK
ncbi:DUF6257 family protein [Streptomyces tirandamycinicus]|uniref:Uncharacterized protein n=1 Tax=Streptomyces tirandamycinicus TaxID=2174846 RepID=A0A2S1SPP8_9ACTN|nr:DUF6257 family protein [Streptomyces tirandamycinicus]AWI28369.1 hypothetical protein DDW44_05880 [Streptomyces tirandamycinicus]